VEISPQMGRCREKRGRGARRRGIRQVRSSSGADGSTFLSMLRRLPRVKNFLRIFNPGLLAGTLSGSFVSCPLLISEHIPSLSGEGQGGATDCNAIHSCPFFRRPVDIPFYSCSKKNLERSESKLRSAYPCKQGQHPGLRSLRPSASNPCPSHPSVDKKKIATQSIRVHPSGVPLIFLFIRVPKKP
jgi:hypothetical protein